MVATLASARAVYLAAGLGILAVAALLVAHARPAYRTNARVRALRWAPIRAATGANRIG